MSIFQDGQTLLYCRFNKIIKGLELVSSLQHWAKNTLKMFVMEDISIWPSFILIVLGFQKK